MPSRSVPFGVKPRTWSATSSPRKPSMGSPASNPYAPTPRACWIPAANTGVLKTVSTTFATSPLMKIARASAVAQAPRSWPPFAISPYRFSASPELATSPQHFAAVLVRAIPSSFASSGCDFDVAVIELLYETCQPRVVKVRQVRLIERRAVEQACIPLANLLANRRVSASDRVGVHHLIGDQVAHTLPVALH